MTELGEFAMGLAMAAGMAGVFFGPIGQALGRRITHGRTPPSPAGVTSGEVQAERMAVLEDRLAQLEMERNQLEERVDFAERLLAQGPVTERREAP